MSSDPPGGYRPPASVYLIVDPQGAIIGSHLVDDDVDNLEVLATARATGAAVAVLPILHDYRPVDV